MGQLGQLGHINRVAVLAGGVKPHDWSKLNVDIFTDIS